MQTAYLICGSTGAGKSTYARKLAADSGALVFSIDEWMKTLFWMDARNENGFDWAVERVRRCEDQIWKVAKLVLRGHRDVIFDLGFSTKAQRLKFNDLVRSSGSRSVLHFLNLPVSIRRERVRERNRGASDTFEFEVYEKTFDWMESYFEPPDLEELRDAVVIGV